MQDDGDKSFICTYPVCKSKRTLKDIWNVNALSLCQSFHIAQSHLPTSPIPKPTTMALEKRSFISVIRDVYKKYVSHSFLPSPSTYSKWLFFTGFSPKFCVFIISPHASYVCGSILLELYVQYVRTSLPEIQSIARIVMNAVQIFRNSCFCFWHQQ
jgi:hypothetical protein